MKNTTDNATRTNTIVTTLKSLCHDSERTWEDAIDGASYDGNEKETKTRDAAEGCVDHWVDAIQAVEEGDFPKALESLRYAARISDDFGSDDPEREAISVVVAASVRVVSQTQDGDELRTIISMVSHKGDQVTGDLIHEWDTVNDTWAPSGNSIDCWVSPEIYNAIPREGEAAVVDHIDDVAVSTAIRDRLTGGE